MTSTIKQLLAAAQEIAAEYEARDSEPSGADYRPIAAKQAVARAGIMPENRAIAVSAVLAAWREQDAEFAAECAARAAASTAQALSAFDAVSAALPHRDRVRAHIACGLSLETAVRRAAEDLIEEAKASNEAREQRIRAAEDKARADLRTKWAAEGRKSHSLEWLSVNWGQDEYYPGREAFRYQSEVETPAFREEARVVCATARAAAEAAEVPLRNPIGEADALLSAYGLETESAKRARWAAESAAKQAAFEADVESRWQKSLAEARAVTGLAWTENRQTRTAKAIADGHELILIGDTVHLPYYFSASKLPIAHWRDRWSSLVSEVAQKRAEKSEQQARMQTEHERLYAALEKLLGAGARSRFRASEHRGRAQLTFAHAVTRKRVIYYAFDGRRFLKLGHGAPAPITTEQMVEVFAKGNS